MSFWGELKRRNVFRVAAVYLIVSWLIVQIVSALSDPLALPEWFDTIVVVLLGIGLPIALVLAWAYELKPDSGSVAEPAPAPALAPSGQKLNIAIIALLVLALGFMALDRFALDAAGDGGTMSDADDEAQASEQPSRARSAMPNSIAFLPLDYIGPTEFADYADGLHTIINGELQRLASLTIIDRFSVLPYANSLLSSLEVADALNVELLLRGTLVYTGGEIRCELTLVDPATNVSLWNESYPGVMDRPMAVYADIAMNVAEGLDVRFSPQEQQILARVSTDSREAYELYVAAQGTAEGNRQLELLEQALDIDPEFIEAWLAIGGVHGTNIGLQIGGAVQEAYESTLAAARRVLALDSDSAAAHGLLAYAHSQMGNFIEAHRERDIADDLGAPISTNAALAVLDLAVADFATARDVFEAHLRTNPLNGVAAGFLLLAYDRLSDADSRADLYERGELLHNGVWWGRLMATYLRLGERDLAFLAANELGNFPAVAPFIPTMEAVRPHIESPADGMAALRERYADPASRSPHGLMLMAAWAAFFGDTDQSFDWLAEGLRAQPGRVWLVWLDIYAGVRTKPEFVALIDEIGLPDYWDEYGWTDVCRRTDTNELDCE